MTRGSQPEEARADGHEWRDTGARPMTSCVRCGTKAVKSMRGSPLQPSLAYWTYVAGVPTDVPPCDEMVAAAVLKS